MDVTGLYRIPWTKDDNPNGWVEVTTHCQLDCPGCYRDFDDGQEASPVEKLVELQRDTDTLIRIRNIQTLSIAGGDPLLYPLLDELVSYVSSRGVAPRLFTNGVLLDERRLRELVSAGCAEVIIHASLWQNRLRPNTLSELLELKARCCEMFRAVGNIRLGFIGPAMRSNLDEFDVLFDFYRRNADVVGNVVFTTFKDVYGGPSGEHVPVDEISERIEESYGTRPCAFIPKLYHPERVAWLLNVAILRDGQVVEQMDKDEYETLQEMYRMATGKYMFTPDSTCFQPTAGAGPGHLQQQDYQIVSIVDSPQMLDDGRLDMCDSCPDAMLYEGELVPKCVLDKIKGGLKAAVQR